MSILGFQTIDSIIGPTCGSSGITTGKCLFSVSDLCQPVDLYAILANIIIGSRTSFNIVNSNESEIVTALNQTIGALSAISVVCNCNETNIHIPLINLLPV